ncbi:MAG: protein NO VEIN domain-containing protein, partial [bacterium]
RYERITFERNLISIPGKPLAAFVCPGRPLLDATIDLILERYRDLLKRGATLIDPENRSDQVRALFYLEHSIQDARLDRHGNRRMISREMQFVEIEGSGQIINPGYAPYLDYRPLTEEERLVVAPALEANWLRHDLEAQIIAYAAEHLVPQHLQAVKTRKEELVRKTMAAVKERLTKEITFWDNRAQELKAQEQAGKSMARINSALARQRCDELEARLQKRMEELEQERHLSPLPPVVVGGALVVPQRLLEQLAGTSPTFEVRSQAERERIERMAINAVMAMERQLGREPVEAAHNHPGYDIESRDPLGKRLLFIEVKGKTAGVPTATISKTQILTAFNKPEDFILAIVEVEGDLAKPPRYIRQPFQREPDFGVTSVNYDLMELLEKSVEPS